MNISDPQIELLANGVPLEFSTFVQFLHAAVNLVLPTWTFWMNWEIIVERKRDFFRKQDQEFDFIVGKRQFVKSSTCPIR